MVRACLLLNLLLLPVLGGWTAHCLGQPSSSAPFPLRRIVIPPERMAAELQRLGVLVQMPRADFEAQVRRATQTSATWQAPRLVKAAYSAVWTGTALTGGSGQWTVHHVGPAPGALPVANLNLALTKIKLNNADAILGELDGKNLGLWIEQPGTHDVYFDWSARGQPLHDGFAFDLRLPTCPMTLLDLTLPSDHTVTLGKGGGLALGPLDTERPQHKRWRLQVTGRSQVDFVIRKIGDPSAPRRLFATVESRQQLVPGAVQADFDIAVESSQHAVSDLVFDYDAPLQPYDVVLRQAELKSWDLAPPTAGAKDPSGKLIVRLREPRQGKFQARIRCLMSQASHQEWVSPALRLRGAVPRGESLRILTPQGQTIESWDPGPFRLLHASNEQDGSRMLELVNLDPEATPRARPRLTLQSPRGQWTSRQHARWSIQPTGMTFQVEMIVTARHGPLHQITLQAPPAPWRVEELAWDPKETLRSWTAAGNLVVVDLQKSLAPGATGKVTIRWRAPLPPSTSAPQDLAIPDLVLSEAAQRQATYAILVDGPMEAALVKSSAPPSWPDAKFAEASAWPRFWFAYRDQSLDGTLRLIQTPATQKSLAPLGLGDPKRNVAVARAPQAHRPFGPDTTVPLLSLGANDALTSLPALAVSRHLASARLQPRFDHALLQTSVEAGGARVHRFRFLAVHWPQPDLPIVLPLKAQRVLAARLDGRWLDQVATQARADGIEVKLPMPTDDKSHGFEIVYETELGAALWPGVLRGAAEMPRLPVAPLRARQVWRLAPGLTPLHQERFASLQQGMGAPSDWLRHFWHGLDPVVDASLSATGQPWLEPQRLALLTAEAGLRRKNPRDAVFGDALQRLLFDGLKEQYSLALDRHALREAGIEPDAALSQGLIAAKSMPFWESLGLVYVPTPAAPLLTTTQRWQEWREGRELPPGLYDAVADAVAHGQDALGQCCRADVWLRGEIVTSRESGGRYGPTFAGFEPGATDWESLPGIDDPSSLIVVDRTAVRVVGWLGGVTVFVVLIAVRRRLSAALRLRCVIMFLVADLFTLFSAPLALVELTLWPAVALVALLILDYRQCLLNPSAAAAPPSTQRRRTALVSGAVVVAALGGAWLARAQSESPDLNTVYLVETGPERSFAFVRPELLKRLEEWGRRAAQPNVDAVLVSANYQAKANGPVTDFQAQFEVYSFAEQTLLHVPLNGVELKEGAFLRGAPVFPTAAVGKAGFLVPVVGKGWQRLSLSFFVRQQTSGDLQELRCTLPALSLNQFEWQAPAALTNLHVVRSGGEVSVALDGGKTTQSVRAQLGRESQLQVRWRSAKSAPTANEAEVREHYYWDLDPRAPSLTAVLAYTPAKKNLARLEIALPETIEVRGVDWFSDSPSGLAVKWQVLEGSGPRRLAVEPPTPAAGPFQVHLHLVPRGRFTLDTFSLRLPMPLSAKPAEGILAYRLDGMEITDKTKNLGVTGLTPEAFTAAWQRSAARPQAAPTRAYSFHRSAATASLELTVTPLSPRARLSVDWEVTPDNAAARIGVDWTQTRPLLTVEVLLPSALKNIEVRGPNLQHWTFQKNRLRVWLEKPSPQVALTILGDLPRPLTNSRFVLPVVQVPHSLIATSTVGVRAGTGWSATAERLDRLTRATDGAEVRYQPNQADYHGIFLVSRVSAAPTFESLTTAEPRGDQVAVTTTVWGQQSHGEFPVFTLRWRDWAGGTPRLHASIVPVRQEHRREGTDHVWTVAFSAGTARAVQLTLQDTIAVSKPFSMPRLEIDGRPMAAEYAAWTTALHVKEVRGLKDAKATAENPAPSWVALRAVGMASRLMRAEQPQWQCLLQATTPARKSSGKLHFVEHLVEPVGVGRWLHQSDWLLSAPGMRDLRVQLPAGSSPWSANVDGQDVALREETKEMVSIPLPAKPSLIHVRLMCNRATPDSPTQVSLAQPSLPDLEASDEHNTLNLPPGWQAVTWPNNRNDTEAPRLLALARLSAEIAAGLKKDASDSDPAALAAWRSQYQSTLRHLEYLARLRNDAVSLAAVAKLRKEHPPTAADATPAAKGQPAWLVARPDQGTPIRWTGPTTAELELRLQTPAEAALWWTREIYVLALVGVFLLSWLPGGLRWFVACWPEQIAGLVALGWIAWGGSLAALVLLGAAAAGRVLAWAAWLRRRIASARAAAEPGSAARRRSSSAT